MHTKGQPVPVIKARVQSAIFIAAAGLLSSHAAQAAVNLYVKPNGSATSNCNTTALACNLDRARAIVRTKTAPMGTTAPSSDVVVNLAAGNYPLTSAFQLVPEDSGKDPYSVIYQGPVDPNTPAILNGGITLPTGSGSGREVHDSSKNIWRIPVPAGVNFRQLYLNGSKAVRARYPNETDAITGAGYLEAVSTVNNLATPTAVNFVVNTGAVPVFQKITGAEVVWIHHWQHLRAKLNSIDPGATTRKLNLQANHEVYYKFAQDRVPYYFENDLALLDAPGEWYFDPTPTAPRVYFIPRAGESGSSVEVIVPQLQTLVEIAGTSTNAVHNIKFRNLTFKHSTWNAPSTSGYGVYQAAMSTVGTNEPVPGAVSIKNADKIALENNVFTRTGAHSVLLTGGATNYRVVNNRFSDLSGGGVYDMAEYSRDGLISNNRVNYYGRSYADSVGILARKPSTLTISHNTIQAGGYSGISLGDFGIAGTGNQVLNNYISNVVRLVDDGAGIYTLGKLTNTLFSGNWVSDVKTSTLIGSHYPAVGIYLDESTNGRTVQNNVVQNASQNFKLNVGFQGEPTQDNIISGNYHTTLNVGAVTNGTNIVSNNYTYKPGGSTQAAAEAFTISINAGSTLP